MNTKSFKQDRGNCEEKICCNPPLKAECTLNHVLTWSFIKKKSVRVRSDSKDLAVDNGDGFLYQYTTFVHDWPQDDPVGTIDYITGVINITAGKHQNCFVDATEFIIEYEFDNLKNFLDELDIGTDVKGLKELFEIDPNKIYLLNLPSATESEELHNLVNKISPVFSMSKGELLVLCGSISLKELTLNDLKLLKNKINDIINSIETKEDEKHDRYHILRLKTGKDQKNEKSEKD